MPTTVCQALPLPSKALVMLSMPLPIPFTAFHPLLKVSKPLTDSLRHCSYTCIRLSMSLRWPAVTGLSKSLSCLLRSLILAVSSSKPMLRIFSLYSRLLRLPISVTSRCCSCSSIPRCIAAHLRRSASMFFSMLAISSALACFCFAW